MNQYNSNDNNVLVTHLRKYFSTAPVFNSESPFYTDFNSSEPTNYSLNLLPSPEPQEDILKNKYFSKNFAITSREFTPTDLERIKNLALCQQLEEWVEEQNDNENYPDLGVNIEVTKISITDSGYLYSENQESNTGLYQIQFKIDYIKYKK